ncbi:aldehyde dehydrogenase family protein, partial [bacterium CPR1]|nr:aldehyde dehydrogenase family protein [bacterium CPR1]
RALELPTLMASWKVAAALSVGNTVMLKPRALRR